MPGTLYILLLKKWLFFPDGKSETGRVCGFPTVVWIAIDPKLLCWWA